LLLLLFNHIGRFVRLTVRGSAVAGQAKGCEVVATVVTMLVSAPLVIHIDHGGRFVQLAVSGSAAGQGKDSAQVAAIIINAPHFMINYCLI
jgi:hypothetical protein